MVKLTVLAGGFSTFISTYVFDSDAGSLNLTKNTTTGANPSWIALHPKNASILYAVNEESPVGNLQSFLVDTEGALTLVDTVTTGGNGPTYTEVLSTGEVTGLNFGSPNMSIVPTDPNEPLKFVKSADNVVAFPVNGGPSNPHMSLEHNGEVFIPDLGADKIWRLKKEGNTYQVKGQIEVAAGNGPRHIAIQDEILFTVHEKTSRLTAQTIPADASETAPPVIANVSIVPPTPAAGTFTPTNGATFNGSFFAAEILISQPTEKFPNSLIYVSNRNLGPDFDPKGDTIAIFEFKKPSTGVGASATPAAASISTGSAEGDDDCDDDGDSDLPTPTPSQALDGDDDCEEEGEAAPVPTQPAYIRRSIHSRFFARRQTTAPVPSTGGAGELVLVAQIHTGLRQIRSMALGPQKDGADEFLIAGANTEGGVAVFKRTDGGRNLELVTRNNDNQNRTSFVFL